MKTKDVVFSWDIFVSVILTILFCVFIPGNFKIEEASQLFLVSITVLAILFTIFLAVLVVMISSGDNEFLVFLEHSYSYKKILS